jgi:hypothetical protein
VVCCLLLAGTALAAGIDGKWYAERKMERDGQSFVVKTTLDLKSSGNKLTGTVTTSFGEKELPPAEVKDGKLDGNKFSFTTIARFGDNEFKTKYEGTVDGDTIKGTAMREGGQGGGQPRPFEARRK